MPSTQTLPHRELVVWAIAAGLMILYFLHGLRLDGECTIWGSAESNNYGQGRLGPMHRAAYQLFNGPIGDGQLVCHTCDRKRCVNPAHIYAGSHADNNRDTVERLRRPAAAREDVPCFTTWDEWEASGWLAEDTPYPYDSEGSGFDPGTVELTRDQLARIDRAPTLCVVEAEQDPLCMNPDCWTEEDERSLMVLGYLDGREPKSWSQPGVDRMGRPVIRSMRRPA